MQNVQSGSFENTHHTEVETVCRLTTFETVSNRLCQISNYLLKKIWLWTESTIASAWIKTEPHKQNICKQQGCGDPNTFKRLLLETEDLISGGCYVEELIKNEIWFSGPDLQTDVCVNTRTINSFLILLIVKNFINSPSNKGKYLTANELKRVSEGRFILGTFRSERNASTLPIMPRRPSLRDVGTRSYRYHTAAYSPASDLANR
ncbi:uncharacterized protein TNCV_930071 [Trichonephila clavipes]|uniref:Uncharacterized protein n=1 Tax=Trichonephila clavipes TaxID=2585209 RepID=A0A8X7BCG9_TRICX|nr:uncharacterized protein TNCV_930071 [Trichonephila clavipes]